MVYRTFILFVGFVFSSFHTFPQDFNRYTEAISSGREEGADFRIGFYNCENLFDLEDDSLTRDESFTPAGSKHYTYKRYKKKLDGIAKTIIAMGGEQPVDIIGLCEVESKWVMDGLTKFSPLKNGGFEYVHKDSPDQRGIDVACIYNPETFNLILFKYYRIKFPFDTNRTTRDLLYLKGILPNKDSLHFFVNHWPSRYGGQFASEPSRVYVADFLKSKIDSLNNRFKSPLIVICGDFNDEPDDISLSEHLKASPPSDSLQTDLINLMFPIKYKFGTHSFAGEWGVLDQFIISAPLMDSENKTYTQPNWVGVFDAPWLLIENAAGDKVPYRTYQGPEYKGGYSDHLPIFLDLKMK